MGRTKQTVLSGSQVPTDSVDLQKISDLIGLVYDSALEPMQWKAGRWLVRNQKTRFTGQGHRDHHALAHAIGQVRYRLPGRARLGAIFNAGTWADLFEKPPRGEQRRHQKTVKVLQGMGPIRHGRGLSRDA